jgi:predicted nucleic acid-binding protein
MPDRPAALLDTHILYRLVVDPEALVAATTDGAPLDLIYTHVQRDQVSARPPDGIRAMAIELLGRMRLVLTAGVILDVSRVDESTVTSEADAELLHERGAPQSTKELVRRASDRLLATTARREGAVLVTDDVRLTKHARRHAPELALWPWERFREELLRPR